MLLSYMEEAERELVDWARTNCSFPNSMVDRITPVTTQSDVNKLKSEFGLEDRWPVTCEPFTQWVIDNYTLVKSKFANSKYVNHHENKIYYQGSDTHYAILITMHGKTIGQLFEEWNDLT